MNTTKLIAPDIECDGCAAAIKKALARVDGVREVAVDIDTKTVTVTHNASTETVVSALDAAGFPAHAAVPQTA